MSLRISLDIVMVDEEQSPCFSETPGQCPWISIPVDGVRSVSALAAHRAVKIKIANTKFMPITTWFKQIETTQL